MSPGTPEGRRFMRPPPQMSWPQPMRGTGGVRSSALHTDRYELTMLDASLRSGVAEHRSCFEVFARSLPPGRRFGVFAGLGRLIEELEEFRFGPSEIDWLRANSVVSARTLDWLVEYRFRGDIHSYREGELYTAGSPVLTVIGTFGEAVLLETVVLSVLNYDSAMAAAASLMVRAARGRSLVEMGTRRTDVEGAIGAARAAYLAGFATTSNLEAGRRYGIPTAGTAAHAFVLAYPSEREAFAAQVGCLGPSTTLLVDTFDTEQGIRNAVEVAGTELGAVRIDSGDLASETWKARRLLDELGAGGTKIVVTGDLDDARIRSLAGAPVDSYGVGTKLVTGLGAPTAGFVYKLVSVARDVDGVEHPVEKRSPGKFTVGGRKWAWRARLDRVPPEYEGPAVMTDGEVTADLVGSDPSQQPEKARTLQEQVVTGGAVTADRPLEEARQFHQEVSDALGDHESLILVRLG